VSQDSSDDLEELLRSDNLSEIQEEVENLNFLILKLREKLSKSQVGVPTAYHIKSFGGTVRGRMGDHVYPAAVF
jgi:hypothetical protein